MNQLAIILDFGGQNSHLIARIVRECGVYSEVMPFSVPIEEIKAKAPMAIILTGDPESVCGDNVPSCSAEIFDIGVPVLGICYGARLIAAYRGGEISKACGGEYGLARLSVQNSALFTGIPEGVSVWVSQKDEITKLPPGFSIAAKTAVCTSAAIEDTQARIYALQFRPELEQSECGRLVIDNFLKKICGFNGDWNMGDYVERTIDAMRQKLSGSQVLCALSGGVDSTVSAVMTHRAVGDKLVCILVDHGLMRKNEADEVETLCRGKFKMNLIRVNASERFLVKLAGVTDPEQKRKIIGEEFIRVFEEQARNLGKIDYLVQGTIYPDIIESGTGSGRIIKSHHNVGGLPEAIEFKEIIEPLRLLFKDEVRQAGIVLGIDEEIVWRQPFPGPGLAVRVIGDLTKEKLDILRESDAIFREEIANAGLSREISQFFAILTNVKSVGVTGDLRTYDYTVALRAIKTTDFMTANYAHLPYEILSRTSTRIVNEVKNVSRIVYDITQKPPSTIEWE